MKNLKKIAVSKAGVISIVSIGVILFSISTIESTKKTAPFEVQQSTITLSGANNEAKWTLQSNIVFSTGNFEFRENELLDIANLSFILPITQLKSTNHQQESILHEIFRQNNCNQLTFKQGHVMILPILKKAHVIGIFSMVNGSHNIPLQLDYELNGDRSLRIWGKQVISLSKFGIKIPEFESARIADEIELGVDFILVNTSTKPLLSLN
jgi:hypothetical protein